MWILSVNEYDKVMKVVRPKKEKARLADNEYQEKMQSLNIKREELRKIMKKLNDLEGNYSRNH